MIEFKLMSDIGYNQLRYAVSTDELRPVMQGVNVNIKHKRLEVTNAHILICYGIESESNMLDTDSIILPTKLFNKSHYYSRLDLSKLPMDCFNFKVCLKSNIAYVFYNDTEVYKSYLIEGKYPSVEAVLNFTKGEMSYDFNVSLDLMTKIKKATLEKGFSNNYEFCLNGINKALKFKKINNENIYGLIMPCVG